MDFGRKLLSVSYLRAQGLSLPDTHATDRRGAQKSRRPEIRLGRRGLDPTHHGRTHRQRDQNKISAHSLSRRGAGHDRPPARGHRFHRGNVRTDQRAHPLGRIPRARRHGQDALARFSRRAHGRGGSCPGFEVISWTGLAGPAKLPRPIVDKLNAEVRRAISVPDVKDKLESMGGDPRATTPAEMRELVASQFATWRRLAKEANISID